MARTGIVVLILVSTAGCAGSPTASEPIGSTPTSEAAASSSPTPAAGGVAFGETITTPRGSLMSVHSVTPGRRTAAPPAGTEWISADVEFCVTKDLEGEVVVLTIRDEFELELEDGTLLDPTGAGAEADEVFSDATLLVGAGECLRGPVVFAVPSGVRPTTFVLATRWGDTEWPLDA